MCGFVTLVQRSGSPDMALVASMAHALQHRGPDGEGAYSHVGVAMHHKRLAIIDVQGGHQPMQAEGVAISFNGEIYNYLELRRELEALGHAFETQSDTEVLLRMYLQFGNECVPRLNGMFSFVLHDPRRRTLLAARDHFGIKPLYFMRIGNNALAFASEIKALLRHPRARSELDPTALEDYLSLQFVLRDRTMFKGIFKVEPAHYLVIDEASLEIATHRYWQPDFDHVEEEAPEQALDQIRELLFSSIKRQMRSDVPVGAYLSGGLDSSFVAASAAALTGHRFETFTGAFREGPEFDETPYAYEVADHIGARAHTLYPTDRDFIDLLPRPTYHMDEPAAGPGLFPQFMVSQQARHHVKVCLGGQGGDELFVGYARYLIGALEETLLDSVQGKFVGPGRLSLSNLEHCLGTLKTYMPLLRRTWALGVDAPGDQRYFRILNRLDANATLLAPDLRRKMRHSEVQARFSEIFNLPTRASHLKRMLHFDLVTTLPTLLHVEDRASMAASLESRVPLLDHELVQRVASLPDRMLLAGGFSKAVLRHAAKELLPERVLNRTDKMGFPVPLQRWIKGSARGFVRDMLLSQRARERGIFCPDQIETLIGNEFEFGRTLWGALQIEMWHRTFIDGDNTADAAVHFDGRERLHLGGQHGREANRVQAAPSPPVGADVAGSVPPSAAMPSSS